MLYHSPLWTVQHRLASQRLPAYSAVLPGISRRSPTLTGGPPPSALPVWHRPGSARQFATLGAASLDADLPPSPRWGPTRQCTSQYGSMMQLSLPRQRAPQVRQPCWQVPCLPISSAPRRLQSGLLVAYHMSETRVSPTPPACLHRRSQALSLGCSRATRSSP